MSRRTSGGEARCAQMYEQIISKKGCLKWEQNMVNLYERYFDIAHDHINSDCQTIFKDLFNPSKRSTTLELLFCQFLELILPLLRPKQSSVLTEL